MLAQILQLQQEADSQGGGSPLQEVDYLWRNFQAATVLLQNEA